MQDTFMNRLAHAWNVFRNKEPTSFFNKGGTSFSVRPDKTQTMYTDKASIVESVYNRIALDVATLDFRHVRVDDDEIYQDTIKSNLNSLFSLEANIDQTGRNFIQDIVHSACEEGFVALVPVETGLNPNNHSNIDIFEARVGKIVEFYPEKIRVDVYNKATGEHEEVVVDKSFTPIIENPLYAIMNQPNSVLKRLIAKLNLLDIVDNRTGAGKLDLIIQLPYVIKTDTRQKQAEKRKADIENQLNNSNRGIAYIDAAENITQLNRPVDSDLIPQVEYLTKMFYDQIGLTKGIFDGTADEKEVNNYYNRTIEPWGNAIKDEVRRKWLTKTARTQGQSFDYFRDMFKLIPLSELADIVEKLTNAEVASSNDIRAKLGWKPHNSERANQLINKNINTLENTEGTKVKMEEKSKKGESE